MIFPAVLIEHSQHLQFLEANSKIEFFNHIDKLGKSKENKVVQNYEEEKLMDFFTWTLQNLKGILNCKKNINYKTKYNYSACTLILRKINHNKPER